MRRISFFDLFGTLALIVGVLFFIFFVLILPRSWTGSDYDRVWYDLTGDDAPTLTPMLTYPAMTNTPSATLTPHAVTLIIENQSGRVICGVYSGEDNLLRGNPPIKPNAERAFEFMSDVVLLRVDDCDGIPLASRGSPLSANTRWVIPPELSIP